MIGLEQARICWRMRRCSSEPHGVNSALKRVGLGRDRLCISDIVFIILQHTFAFLE